MNKINRITCKFKNPEVESNFLDHNWKTQSKSVTIGLYFTIVIMILNIIPEFFERTSNSNLIGFVVLLLGSVTLLKSTDIFRRKYTERFFSIYLSVMIPVNSYLNLNIYRQDYDLPAFPLIIIIFILMMRPISVLWAAPASLIAFISAILTLDHSKMETQVYFFYILFFS